jgi:hypothetical protein
VVNRDSFPITHEIIQDRQTLAPCLIASRSTPASRKGPPWCNRPWYGFDDNIAELKKHKPHYVVASRQPDRDRWLAEFEDPKDFTPVRRESLHRSMPLRRRPR